MASLSDISNAATGLAAARRLIDVAGNNLANASSTGYTRRRVELTETTVTNTIGQTQRVVASGVNSSSTIRLSNELLNAQVRQATANSNYSTTRSTALSSLEDATGSISDGLSSTLTTFWSSWSDLANDPSSTSAGAAVIQDGKDVASAISTGYQAASSLWTSTRADLSTQVDNLNSDATQLATVNGKIAQATAAGQDTSDLLDQRDALMTSIQGLVGGTSMINSDGTASVFVGGNLLVDGTTANAVTVSGSSTAGSATSLVWANHTGVSVGADGGTIAADLSLIGPTDSTGTGGAINEAMAAYNSLATSIANQVNAVHSAGSTTSGTTGLAFFSIGDATSAATTLTVVPTSVSQIATGASGAGSLDGSVADAISQLGTGSASPDASWTAYVTRLGAQVSSESAAATSASSALSSATSNQQAVSSVDTDEENENLLTAQAAYQANARVLTAIDQMLDTLINKTGLVGLS